MRLSIEQVQRLKNFTDTEISNRQVVQNVSTLKNLIDTIEALQHENKNLQKEIEKLKLLPQKISHQMLDKIEALQQEIEQLKAQVVEVKDKGEISDGYHTFNELYYHRMVLFAVICNHNKDIAWKSWKHADGTMFDNYFIVGITTPKGDYTYHYQKQYWDIFDVKELEFAPEWDGHQPKDIDRLLSIIPNADYHNPADVEALRKARKALKYIQNDVNIKQMPDYETIISVNEAIAEIDKAIGGGQ